ncbi:MAG: hypothetical protein P8J87_05765 [Verrucomicrobiales bacterium]|nr:hypothetical protein [Verrucomicrobiales bacterium]
MTTRLGLALALLATAAPAAAGNLPAIRVQTEGFGASEADIKAVIDSATTELWKHFPGHQIEPVVVTRGHKGPITLFQRNIRKEIVVRLDTSKTYWSQYAYQWSHELCHILCAYRNDASDNKWFEESLCELASLYTMRAMAGTWKTTPPYSNWKDYSKSLSSYAGDIIAKHPKLTPADLGKFYAENKTALRSDATRRNLNATVAIALLPLFETTPSRWAAVRYLNTTPATAGMSLTQYLKKWHDDAPEIHRPFIRSLATHFTAPE